MLRIALSYVVVLTFSCAAIALVLTVGSEVSLQDPLSQASPVDAHSVATPLPMAIDAALMNHLREPMGIFLCQMIVILGAARLLGTFCVRIGQPAVIGEMLAGIALGPSVLGRLGPDVMIWLFPPASLDTLHQLSQVGIIFYMFTIGAGIDIRQLRRHVHAVVWVSHASIVLPFLLGASLSLAMYPSMAPPGVSFIAFALFIGTAMSITAFPVLARIVQERGLFRTRTGSTALACAAVDDITAWCLLAAVVAIVKADSLTMSLMMLLLAVVYSAFMLLLLKPLLSRLWLTDKATQVEEGPRLSALTTVVPLLVLLAGLATHVIGLHAVFGGFLAGMIMPAHDGFRSAVTARFETVSTGLFLPLFFAVTGLRTQIDLLDSVPMLVLCATVVIVAILGKFGGAMLAARWSGMNWQESVILGALMNTRGLMELIVINVGYDLGILSAPMFAIFVVMALATTMMTAPVVALAQRRHPGSYPTHKRTAIELGRE